MSSNRIGRINEEIARELSSFVREMKDPRVRGVVSVTAVDTSADLRYAKVFVSVLDQERAETVLKGLKSASGWLRRELGNALSLRYVPELVFCLDHSIDKGVHIFSLLKKMEEKNKTQEEP
ncbi:MAG: 30S ribosome-binding factor RbfA [Oscillospiraceae bacterium]|nr:30S ribosome-binding factor RbfA [Oscillospiraceae bacterium]